MRFVRVAIPAPLHTSFTYIVPDGLKPHPGSRLLVPFRRRKTIGICLGLMSELPNELKDMELKSIEEILDDKPSIDDNILKLLQWISSYYCAPIGEVCKLALPSRLLKISPPKTTRPIAPVDAHPFPVENFDLSDEQKTALISFVESTDSKKSNIFLLHGITGSGKTEVYLRLFEKLAADGKQGLLLVPEIGLTPQLMGRAASRFPGRIAVYHSGLTDAQRHEQWMRTRDGKIDVVIGTRSALFAPLSNLGAIVVDEEHDASYKQDDGVTYSGRDAAVMRAHIENIPIVLGSATPSLESLANVKNNKYLYHRLSARHGGAMLPTVEIVDMRAAKRSSARHDLSEGVKKRREFQALSPQLYDAISETLARGEQTLLYIGRRGFAGALQCDSCGDITKCPNCDISLVPHQEKFGGRSSRGDSPKTKGVLACHYCDYTVVIPKSCASCGSETLIPIGHGTERLEAEIQDFFPNATIARLDSDSAAKHATRRKILHDMRSGKIDILVGTQMITKGHDFPSITLVGVISADSTLNIPDFRSAERTFQLLTQVAGRAGRGENPGRVIVQTRQPDHLSFRAAAAHDCAEFSNGELVHRRELSYPPFSRLANIRLSSGRAEQVAKAAAGVAKTIERIRAKFDDGARISILGPAPAPLAKLRGRYRWQLLIKAPTAGSLSKYLALIRPSLEDIVPSGVRLSIDVDPINLL